VSGPARTTLHRSELPRQGNDAGHAGHAGHADPAAGAADVSIVILSWNTREMLLDAIRSFWPVAGLAAELIVVDNASADGSADAVERAFPGARVIRNARNLGFSGGVNVGLAAARSELILLLNSDTLVVGTAIAALVDYARAHPQAGVVGPRVLNRDGTLQASCWRFPSLLHLALEASYLYQLFPASRWFNRSRMGGEDLGAPRAVDAVSGCSFLLRRSLLERIGGLDERYFMYSEDVDFCFQTRKAGFEVHYAPVGEIVHFGGGSSRLASQKMFCELRRSVLRFFWKNHSPARASAARWLLVAFLVLRLPYWAARALIPSAERAAHGARARAYAAAIAFLARPLSVILDARAG
jgi:GT2 family glycosyltransferase